MTTAEVQQVVVMVVHHEQMSKNEMEVVDDFGFTTDYCDDDIFERNAPGHFGYSM